MTQLEETVARAGASLWLHACDIDGDAEVGVRADEPVALASVFKIAVMVELARQVDAGRVSLKERLHVPGAARTIGPTGLSVMLDDVEMSLRDLASSMMTVSDNAATDVVMERLGGAAVVNATMRTLGFERTDLVGDCKLLLADLAAALGIEEEDGDLDLASVPAERMLACGQLRPEGTSRSTPREITRLLGVIWRDEVASPASCAEIRRVMRLQVWPHRVASGFGDEVQVSAKTGTLPGIRNEAGVVELPGGRRYAVAVFTRPESFAFRLPAVDAAMGEVARAAVELLSSQ